MSDKKIIMPLEEIMGDRFGRYSKYIIQDRALPDVRDGLKPVQRRILYAMYKEGNVYSKPYRKSAKTVGVVIGNYHPHGDSSVYDAMIRMSQDWKMRIPLIDVQGNNGSIDNDPAAAMRYTEARLSKIAVELLRDLDKETCPMALNFDDTEYEPTVLPAKYPNLLVNGATGISAGYATDIPPHNFQEVIDATIYRIKKPFCSLEEIMDIVKGPDFPTGAIVEGKEGIKEAFETGKGKVIVRSKAEINQEKSHQQIIITEIPYEVNKADLVRKMDEIRFNRLIDGIIEVRDESDRNGLRIVVDIRKEAPAQNILNYFYKNTDLQKNYNYNMVAICDKRPVQLGLMAILDAYIGHQIEVITKRSLFELEKTKTRLHIVDGLIKAISILDDVVKTIRQSKDKQDAKNNLVKKYQFTEKQAEAIVMLQLYRLTNTDIIALETEKAELDAYCKELNLILDDDKVLRKVIIKELKEVRSLYPNERLTEIKEEISEVVINKEAMIIPEDVYVSVTKDGYVKRISQRSFKASEKSAFGKKDDDYLLMMGLVNTLDKLLLFTNKGNFLYVPVCDLEEFKWKDLGKHISYLVKIESDEKMVGVMVIRQFKEELSVVLASKNGQVKRTALNEFELQRYTKPVKCFNLKNDDELLNVSLANEHQALFLLSEEGYVNFYPVTAISKQGIKASGVKGITLKADTHLAGMLCLDPLSKDTLFLPASRGGYKNLKISDVPLTNRAVKGIQIFKPVKSNPQTFIGAYLLKKDHYLQFIVNNQELMKIEFKDLSTNQIDSRLSSCIKLNLSDTINFIYNSYYYKEEDVPVVEPVQIDQEVHFETLSLDDFLN